MSTPVAEHVRRVGEHELALTAGEEPCEDVDELARDVVVGLGEDLLDAFVDLADDLEEVALGLPQVLELLGQELVALLHRGELLERQRVDLAQHREVALGRLEPLLLLGADVGRRLPGRVGLLLVRRQHRRRHELVRSVLGDQ